MSIDLEARLGEPVAASEVSKAITGYLGKVGTIQATHRPRARTGKWIVLLPGELSNPFLPHTCPADADGKPRPRGFEVLLERKEITIVLRLQDEFTMAVATGLVEAFRRRWGVAT